MNIAVFFYILYFNSFSRIFCISRHLLIVVLFHAKQNEAVLAIVSSKIVIIVFADLGGPWFLETVQEIIFSIIRHLLVVFYSMSNKMKLF